VWPHNLDAAVLTAAIAAEKVVEIAASECCPRRETDRATIPQPGVRRIARMR
jgi:hypothetical protein